MRAIESAWSPAQFTTVPPVMSPAVVRSSTPSGFSAKPKTLAPKMTSTPARRARSRYASVTRAKSTMAVRGEWSALTPRACGSISRSRSGPITSTPGTPLASPRRRNSSSAGISASDVATITLPTTAWGTDSRSQNSISARAPATQVAAFNEPGL